jgi:hypothetical protein
MFKHLVFIDSRVTDYPALVAGLSADTEWALLDEDQDGVVQMQAALAGSARPGFDPHPGARRPGALRIGSGELTCESLVSPCRRTCGDRPRWAPTAMCRSTAAKSARGATVAPSCARWRKPAAPHVAASSAPVGHADLGGAWRLDVGELRTPPLDNPRWHGLLGMTITPVAHSYGS